MRTTQVKGRYEGMRLALIVALSLGLLGGCADMDNQPNSSYNSSNSQRAATPAPAASSSSSSSSSSAPTVAQDADMIGKVMSLLPQKTVTSGSRQTTSSGSSQSSSNGQGGENWSSHSESKTTSSSVSFTY